VLIDSHCHLADPAYDADRAGVVARAAAAGVTGVVVVAESVESAEAARRLAAATPGYVATAGIHPHQASTFSDQAAARVAGMLDDAVVAGVGETGLDYHYDHSPRDVQRESFAWHLAQGARTGKPVVIHSREADDDTARLIGDAPAGLRGVLHCFSAGPSVLDAALARGLCVSWSGMITFKSWNAHWALERVPDDALLVETDGPFLAPVPYRGKRNEPAFVTHTATKLAELRGTTPDRIAELTARNAIRLFGARLQPAAVT
jgi:TatD DNase family protein